MTDVTLGNLAAGRRVDVTSEQAQARVRARYRAERRFRAYGLAALAVTAVFLVVLMADIVRNALPAFTQHSLVIDVPVSAEAIDPGGKKDVATIMGADYFPITRDALNTLVPGIEGRAAQRALTGLLSSGAADALRSQLAADPSLVGKTIRAKLMLSDDADLYLKGIGTPISSKAARGTATPSGTTGEVTILTSSNDFVDELMLVKGVLAERARQITTEADRLARTDSATVAARIGELRKEVVELEQRYKQPKVEERLDSSTPSVLAEINGGLVKVTKLADSRITGDVLMPLKSTDEAKPGTWKVVSYTTPESSRKITDLEVAFLERLRSLGSVERHFNWQFVTSGDSREPELAGIRGALMGTALTLLVTLALCLPIGVMAAIYLEEFAPKNWLTEIIEVNINNLAAVPSIVFGLLGLAVFLNFFGLPRSAPIVGGLVLALLVLPTIIIASRASLKAVPPSIKEAALGVGASHQQAVFHHVLPLAMPGIMTGTIIGMAHALGETAPLLMIGMVAFIVDVPSAFTQAATVLPVQIFLWSDLPEQAFQYKTAAAILVLLVFLFAMNGAAIWMRKKFERRW
jgi:phosphate transport system permease protein